MYKISVKNGIDKIGTMLLLHFFYTALKFLNSKVLLIIKRRKRRTTVHYMYKYTRTIFYMKKE